MSQASVTVKRAFLRRRRFRYPLCAAFVLVVFLLGASSYMGVFNGNVRVVEPNRVYRSGQLTGTQLKDVLKSSHIRAVVNLRGHLSEDVRLRKEREVCRRMGIAHVDISLHAVRLPEPDELRKLLRAFDTLPRPMLIHCAGGSDRTGLASTLYLNVYKSIPLDQAESSQLTWRYGHLSFTKARAMDEFFTLYRHTGRGMGMRKWATERYPVVYPAARWKGRI